MLFTEDGGWKPSKMNKTCFDSLCKVEAFGSLDELRNGDIKNHKQMHEIIVGNYDLLKKGRHGMTKTAAKKLMKSQGFVPDFIEEKIRESYDVYDWPRATKITYSMDLISGVDEELVFPPPIMKKIEKARVPSIMSLVGKDKGVVWFCIQEIQEKKTKNGKVFYRMRVCDNTSESCWLRVWSKFEEVPEPYTMWLAEVASTESWGCSTSSYKMRKIDV
jgi:DNA polymerase III alpha subunit